MPFESRGEGASGFDRGVRPCPVVLRGSLLDGCEELGRARLTTPEALPGGPEAGPHRQEQAGLGEDHHAGVFEAQAGQGVPGERLRRGRCQGGTVGSDSLVGSLRNAGQMASDQIAQLWRHRLPRILYGGPSLRTSAVRVARAQARSAVAG